MRSRFLRRTRPCPVTATLVGRRPGRRRLARARSNGCRCRTPCASQRCRRASALTLWPGDGHPLAAPKSLPYVVLETAAAGMPLITTASAAFRKSYGPLSEPSGAGRRSAEALAGLPSARVLTGSRRGTTRCAKSLRDRVAPVSSPSTSWWKAYLAAYRQALERARPEWRRRHS